MRIPHFEAPRSREYPTPPMKETYFGALFRKGVEGLGYHPYPERTENRWVVVTLGMLAVMMAVIVVTGVTHAPHPPSNVETVGPTTLHLGGEFAESNLGTAVEPDGSVTVRLIAEQYAFIPDCTQVPVDTPVKFRVTSTDVIHGFLLPATNVNTMVVPGFIAEVRTSFTRPGVYKRPDHPMTGIHT
jgi:cytochrome c oxidase subunit 2